MSDPHDAVPDRRNPREVPPARRSGGLIDFYWQNGWSVYTVGYSLHADMRCAEIFLNVEKSDGMAEANARDAGILASFALQHGASLELLVAAVTHEPDGSASSIVGTALNLVHVEVTAEIARRRDDPDAGPSPSPSGPANGGDGGADTAVAVPAEAE